MESTTMARSVKGAIELVRMLEILVEGEIDQSSSGEMPWAGFRLLLTQAKDLLQPVFRPNARRSADGSPENRSLVKGEDTLHLLRVLERLAERLQRNEGEVPWYGILHTLAQTREILSVLAETLQSGDSLQSSVSPSAYSSSSSSSSSSAPSPDRTEHQWSVESIDVQRSRSGDDAGEDSGVNAPTARARNLLSAFSPVRS